MSSAQRTQGGISVRTLLIAAAASATAAFVIPMVWRPGTVFAAAMTPVIVTLVSEMLRRPVESVSTVRVRRTARGTAILDPPTDEPFDPLAPASAEELAVLPETREGPRAEHRRRPLTARQWKLGLATGLVVFAVVAVVLTGSELVAGSSVTNEGGRTTFFSGSSSSSKQKSKQGEQEQSPQREQQKNEQPSPTATPSTTAEPAPTTTATPVPTVAPTATPGVAPAEPAPTP